MLARPLRTPSARLLAVSDLHAGHPHNRAVVDALRPADPGDWLIVAGDVADALSDIRAVLGLLRERFAMVVWTPGNHELWADPRDPAAPRGVARYEALVQLCHALDVLTPEDAYPVWDGPGGPARVAPLFVLYDYSFRVDGTRDKAMSLAAAEAAGVVCADELLLPSDPYPTREAWCRDRAAATERRLAASADGVPLVLVNHWPLLRGPTRVLRHPEFAQWCGTELTADWHRRFDTAAVAYGHLHIPRTELYDGVPFEEVSLGYPREWQLRGGPSRLPRTILPRPA